MSNVPKPNPNRTYPYLAFERVSKKTYFKVLKELGYSQALELTEIPIPERKTKYSAGYDLVTPVHITLKPGESKLIPTGIKVKIQLPGVYAGVYVRSGISTKLKISMINNKGVIDPDHYDNEQNEGMIFVPLINLSDKDVNIPIAERIAQVVFEQYFITDNDAAEKTAQTRTGGGFGSTGSK